MTNIYRYYIKKSNQKNIKEFFISEPKNNIVKKKILLKITINFFSKTMSIFSKNIDLFLFLLFLKKFQFIKN